MRWSRLQGPRSRLHSPQSIFPPWRSWYVRLARLPIRACGNSAARADSHCESPVLNATLRPFRARLSVESVESILIMPASEGPDWPKLISFKLVSCANRVHLALRVCESIHGSRAGSWRWRRLHAKRPNLPRKSTNAATPRRMKSTHCSSRLKRKSRTVDGVPWSHRLNKSLHPFAS